MIDKPTDKEKFLIWEVLLHAIRSNSGIGFSHNADQGHPVYVNGMNERPASFAVDTPETNTMFKLLASFDSVFHEEHQDLRTWEQFCRFAVESHYRAKGWED